MVALSDRKTEIVKTLVQSAPDGIVSRLRQALAESAADSVLASVQRLVEAEAVDRALRNAAFQPVAPLCVGSDGHMLTFPPQALPLVWRGLKVSAPNEMAAAVKVSEAARTALANEQTPPDPSHTFNVLVGLAAKGLRAGQVREFRTAAELCERARPGGAEAFAACLDIAPIVRKTLPRLSDWIAQPGDDTSAPARLAYKDAVAVAEDAGPGFFEMLAAQIDPPWMVLRIVSAIMDKPTERYLAQSELGGVPERLMADIDESLATIGRLGPDCGREAGREAGRLAELITQQTFELEVCIELDRERGWGQRIVGQKKALANLVEARLRDVEKLIDAALPGESAGHGRPRKSRPNLQAWPEPRAVDRAMTLLTFAHAVRLCANYGGFSAAHAKLTEKVGGLLDHYVEAVLDGLRAGHADPGIGLAFLAVAADLMAMIRDEKAAELVRRRAAAIGAAPDSYVILDA